MIVCLRELWVSLYNTNGVPKKMSIDSMLAYSTASFVIASFMISPFAETVSARVKSGLIVVDLLRPWSFYGFLFSRAVGIMISNLMTKTTILLLFTFIVYDFPGSLQLNYFLFSISLLFAVLVAFGLFYFISLLSFKFTEVWGIDLLVSTLLMNLLSGSIIPLWIYPKLLREIIYVLPFRAIYDIPLSILIGSLSNAEMVSNISIQATWAVLLFLVGAWVYKKIINKLVISGG